MRYDTASLLRRTCNSLGLRPDDLATILGVSPSVLGIPFSTGTAGESGSQELSPQLRRLVVTCSEVVDFLDAQKEQLTALEAFAESQPPAFRKAFEAGVIEKVRKEMQEAKANSEGSGQTLDVLLDRMNDDDPRVDLTLSLGGLSENVNSLSIQTYLLCGALLAVQRALKQRQKREEESLLLRSTTDKILGVAIRPLYDLCLDLIRLTTFLLMSLRLQE